VLFEQRESHGLFTGYTGNYIKVGVLTEEHLANSFRNVVMRDIVGKIAIGRLGNT
jgi:hypothetical protein